ncbi:hypothetical protein Taro_049830 [Colocasia esculenta]|uniref:Uncharacterized protein n=1 Tax=Colocasia esculenta TaxID=4460 RepID=A0A843XBU1_COLES|nr:hypothetical protein [Colocasia esculenta]
MFSICLSTGLAHAVDRRRQLVKNQKAEGSDCVHLSTGGLLLLTGAGLPKLLIFELVASVDRGTPAVDRQCLGRTGCFLTSFGSTDPDGLAAGSTNPDGHDGPVFSWLVRLCGPADWAQSAHRFSACEHDKGVRCVLNATALVVVFPLPPRCGLRLHAHRVSRVGRLADVDLEKATASYVTFSQGRSCCEGFQVIQCFGVIFGTLSPRGRRMEQGRRRAIVYLRVLHEGREIPSGFVAWIAYEASVGPFVRDRETERRHSCAEALWWYLVVIGTYTPCGYLFLVVRYVPVFSGGVVELCSMEVV